MRPRWTSVAVSLLRPSDTKASFLAAWLVEGSGYPSSIADPRRLGHASHGVNMLTCYVGNDRERLFPSDRKKELRSTSLENDEGSSMDPRITTREALQQCYDSGYKLAEVLCDSSGGHSGVDPRQVVFLSSPLERGLDTAKEAIRGFMTYCKSLEHRKHGGSD